MCNGKGSVDYLGLSYSSKTHPFPISGPFCLPPGQQWCWACFICKSLWIVDLSEKALDQEVCITPVVSLNWEKHVLLLHLEAHKGSFLIAISLTLTTAPRMIFYLALACFVLQYTILYKYLKLSHHWVTVFTALPPHYCCIQPKVGPASVLCLWRSRRKLAGGAGGEAFHSPLHRKHLMIPVLSMVDSHPGSGAKIKGVCFPLHEDTSWSLRQELAERN